MMMVVMISSVATEKISTSIAKVQGYHPYVKGDVWVFFARLRHRRNIYLTYIDISVRSIFASSSFSSSFSKFLFHFLSKNYNFSKFRLVQM